MADKADLRDKLIEARANGLRSVRDQNGEEIVFKSDSEMARAIAALDRETAGHRPSVIYVNKGT